MSLDDAQEGIDPKNRSPRAICPCSSPSQQPSARGHQLNIRCSASSSLDTQPSGTKAYHNPKPLATTDRVPPLTSMQKQTLPRSSKPSTALLMPLDDKNSDFPLRPKMAAKEPQGGRSEDSSPLLHHLEPFVEAVSSTPYRAFNVRRPRAKAASPREKASIPTTSRNLLRAGDWLGA